MSQEVQGAQGYPVHAGQADEGFADLFHTFGQLAAKGSDDCLPAEVISYDRKSNTAKVKPLIQALSTDGQAVSRASVASVPVLALGCGQFFINFPLKPGDKGWIKSCDRDISKFKQAGSEESPNTLRMHSFEDGYFIPDIMRDFSIDPEDMDANMVISHKSGEVRVALWPDKVKTTVGESFFEVRKDGKIAAKAPAGMDFETPQLNVTGDVNMGTGGAGGGGSGVNTIHGTLRSLDGTFIDKDGVILGTHEHTDVMPGGGTTGEPVK